MGSFLKHLEFSENLFRNLVEKRLFWVSTFLFSWVLLWQNRAQFHWDFDYMVMHSTIVMNEPSLLLGRFGFVVPLHLVYKAWSLFDLGVLDFQYALRMICTIFGAGATTLFIKTLIMLRWPPAVAIGAGLMFLSSRYALMVGNDINTNIVALCLLLLGLVSCLKVEEAKSFRHSKRWFWLAIASFGWSLSIRSQSYFYFASILIMLPFLPSFRNKMTSKSWLTLCLAPGLISAIGPVYYSLRSRGGSFLSRFSETHEDMGVQIYEPLRDRLDALFSHFYNMPMENWGTAFLIAGTAYCFLKNRKAFLVLLPLFLAHLVLLYVLNVELLSYRRYFGAFYLIYFAFVALGVQWTIRRDWLTLLVCLYFCSLLRPWSQEKMGPRNAEALAAKRYYHSAVFDCPKFCVYMLGDRWPLAQLKDLEHPDRFYHAIANGWAWTADKLDVSRNAFPHHKFIVDYESHKPSERIDLELALNKYPMKIPLQEGVWEIPSYNDLKELGTEPTNFED